MSIDVPEYNQVDSTNVVSEQLAACSTSSENIEDMNDLMDVTYNVDAYDTQGTCG